MTVLGRSEGLPRGSPDSAAKQRRHAFFGRIYPAASFPRTFSNQ